MYSVSLYIFFFYFSSPYFDILFCGYATAAAAAAAFTAAVGICWAYEALWFRIHDNRTHGRGGLFRKRGCFLNWRRHHHHHLFP